MKPRFFNLTLSIIIVLTFTIFAHAQTGREKGIELFEAEKYRDAINLLNNSSKKDIVARYYLGLSLAKENEAKKAVKIFEDAINECVEMILAEIVQNLENGESENIDVVAIVRQKLGSEIEFAGKSYQQLTSSKSVISQKSNKNISNKLKTKGFILEIFLSNTESPHKDNISDNAFINLNITKKPHPSYTDEARRAGTSGKVKILAAFLKNGKIGFAIPLNQLPNGLTEQAIIAANQIKFEPAMKDGKPMTAFKTIEYTFMVY